jgi:hypothetical protein
MAKLWYYIDDDIDRRNVSSVSVSPNETIDELKDKIFAKNPEAFAGCDAQNLILTKVRFIMVSMNTDVTNGLCWPITPVGRCAH